MGHRHVLKTPQIFETDDNQEWNHAEQPSLHTARVGASDSSAHSHPVDIMTIQGRQSASQWTAAPMPSGYSSTNHNFGMPHYQPQVPGPSHNHFLHQPPAGNFLIPQENYSHHASSSNLPQQTVPRVDAGSSDLTVGNGRGPYKRKRPGIPPMHDASRYHDVGSSSDLPLPSDPWPEMQTTESYHIPWEHPPGYMVNSVCIGGEGALRNVRSRAAVDVENNLVRTHLSTNSLHHSFSSLSSDQSSLVDFWGQSSNAPTREWNHRVISTAGHDTSFSHHEPNTLNTVNSYPSASLEIGGGHNGVTSNRNSVLPNVLPNVQGNLSPPIRGVRSLNGQRYAPTSRPSNNLCPGHVTASDEGLPMVAESYPSRHPRAFPTVRFRNIDRNGRNSDRYRSFTEDPSLRDRMPAEGLVGHSAFYGSRYPFDQHTGMRLDIDNMSYEELLALGERIGNVSTGLSEALISKSLTESIYCLSDQFQEEGKCIICLEEYKNLDDVGTLKICRHDFHVSCIRKWLSIKNSCPICKASALDDSAKDK